MPKRRKSPVQSLVPVHTDARTHLIGPDRIVPLQVYHVPEVHPQAPGPWSREADKIAWIDPVTGLPCIMRRHAYYGYLSGYVAVGRDHPLFGFNADAVPGSLNIEVHGGLSYSNSCGEHDPEDRSVCHVRGSLPGDWSASRHVRGSLPGDWSASADQANRLEDDVWWFGFDCNKSYDLVPNKTTAEFLDVENAPVYRDESYVYLECGRLAAQLHAIGNGEPANVATGVVPPVGMGPFRSGGGL